MPFRVSASVERSPRSALAVLMSFILIVFVAACANSAATPVATSQVDLPRSYRFAPKDIAVQPGTTVTWTNNDNFTHSVRLDGSEEVQVIRPGESTTHAFATAGLYHYVCTFHPQDMQGSVLVEGQPTES